MRALFLTDVYVFIKTQMRHLCLLPGACKMRDIWSHYWKLLISLQKFWILFVRDFYKGSVINLGFISCYASYLNLQFERETRECNTFLFKHLCVVLHCLKHIYHIFISASHQSSLEFILKLCKSMLSSLQLI